MSGGLCDVDLDCAESRALAPYFLPETAAVFGRRSSPQSHWLYVSDLYQNAKRAAEKFEDPTRQGDGHEHGVCLIELRTGRVGKEQEPIGALSVIPPSTHPSGETVTWHRDGDPPRADGSALRGAVSKTAAAALLVRHYPAAGERHEAFLVLGGFLARADWREEQIAAFAKAVATVAADSEMNDRVTAAKGAVAAMRSGTEVAGLPRLREVFGSEIADTLARWLGIPIRNTPTISIDAQIAAQIAELARLSNIDYDRKREDVAKQIGVRKSTLDEEVEKQRAEQRREASTPPLPDLGELAALSVEIISCRDVLSHFAREIGQYIAGEVKNSQLLYLVATSRLFDKGMHAAIKGPSSAGKTEIRERVLEYFPPEDVISFTLMSERALLFVEDDFCHKVLSMGEAMSGEELKVQDTLLRQLMSEGILRYPIAQKVGGKIVTVMVEKHGPVAFLVTTTRNMLNPENETRMLSLEVDDSEQQTKSVLRKVAEAEGYNVTSKGADFRPWHAYQRWLAAGDREVVIPFALTLARLIPPKAVRLRRDVGQLLRAIKTHALLHRQHRRKRDEDGAILATIDEDYTAVRALMSDLLATTAEVKLRAAVAETVAAVKAKQPPHGQPGASVREVAKELKLDRSAAYRRLRQAEDAGLVVNVEERRGHPGQYRTTDEHVPEGIEMLPTVEQLRAALRSSRRTPWNSLHRRTSGH